MDLEHSLTKFGLDHFVSGLQNAGIATVDDFVKYDVTNLLEMIELTIPNIEPAECIRFRALANYLSKNTNKQSNEELIPELICGAEIRGGSLRIQLVTPLSVEDCSEPVWNAVYQETDEKVAAKFFASKSVREHAIKISKRLCLESSLLPCPRFKGQFNTVIRVAGEEKSSRFVGLFQLGGITLKTALSQAKTRRDKSILLSLLAKTLYNGIHLNGLVVCDFKLSNFVIFGIFPQIEVRLVDLDSVVEVDKPCGDVTLIYAPPEVLEDPDTPATYAIDVWSFGMCCLELALGKHPFGELKDRREILEFISSGKLQDAICTVSETDPTGAEFIQSCLQMEPLFRLPPKELVVSPFLTLSKTSDSEGMQRVEYLQKLIPRSIRKNIDVFKPLKGSIRLSEIDLRKANYLVGKSPPANLSEDESVLLGVIDNLVNRLGGPRSIPDRITRCTFINNDLVASSVSTVAKRLDNFMEVPVKHDWRQESATYDASKSNRMNLGSTTISDRMISFDCLMNLISKIAMDESPYESVFCIPVVKGVGNYEKTIDHVSHGMCNVAFLDPGWFGKGVYFTLNTEYARVYGTSGKKKGDRYSMLFGLMASRHIFPVVEHPFKFPSLNGKAAVNCYDTHAVHVKQGSDGSLSYYPSHPKNSQFIEIVASEGNQVLPLIVIEFEYSGKRSGFDDFESLVSQKVHSAPVAQVQNKAPLPPPLPVWQKAFSQKVPSATVAQVQNKSEYVLPKLSSDTPIRDIIQAMRKYPMEGDLQRDGCAALWSLSANNDQNNITIAQEGGIRSIVDAMKNYSMDPKVQQKGCGALLNLALNDQNRIKIAEEEGIIPVINALKNHALDPLVQEQGCKALWNISYHNDKNLITIPEEGGIGLIVDAMANHSKVRNVQWQGCGAIDSLAFGNKKNALSIANKGGIGLVVEAMKNYSSDENILMCGVGALYSLSLHPQNKSKIDSEGTKAVRSAMSMFPNSEHIQKYGSKLISQKVPSATVAQVQKKSEYVPPKAVLPKLSSDTPIRDIIQAMRKYPMEGELQRDGCAAFMNLSLENDQNDIIIAQEGGIRSIINAMKSHSMVASVQEKGCGALWYLSVNDQNMITIAQEGGIRSIVEAMKSHSMVASVQENGCIALRNLSNNNAQNKITIAQEGGIRSIINAMKSHSMVASVQENGCGALRNLSANDQNRITIAQEGGIRSIINAMKSHSMVASVQEEGCAALRNLSNNDQNKITIAQEGGIRSIVGAMKSHSMVASVQNNGCAGLRNLSANNDQNKITIAQEGGIRSIVDAMKSHSMVASVQEEGCVALLNLSVNDQNKITIAQEGGIRSIVEAMKSHFMVELVQEEGCGALSNLSINDQNEITIAQEGGIRSIVEAMKSHSMVASVQEKGCGALWNLSVNDQNKITIAQEGGIRSIVEAMKSHSMVASVQEKGCCALSNLSINDQNSITIAQEGGIRSIVDAMKSHSMVASVQENGCNALSNLSSRNDQNRITIAQEGGIRSIVNAMKSHSMVASVQEKGCGVLWNLSNNNDQNSITIAQEGGIRSIVDAMKNYSMDPKVQQKGCGALLNLALNDQNRIKIAEEEGIIPVINALKNHALDPLVQEQGCKALWNISYHNDKNQITIPEEGGIGLIVDAMAKHSKVRNVQWQGCGAIDSLAFGNKKNALSIANKGGIGLVAEAMKNYSSDENIQMCGVGALYSLSLHPQNKSEIESEGTKAVRSAMSMFPNSEHIQKYGSKLISQKVPSATVAQVLSKSESIPPKAVPFAKSNCVVIYSYEANDDSELGIAEGEELEMIEHDPSGWSTVRNASGREGLVPASYIEYAGDYGTQIKALYDFEARESNELSMYTGEILTVISVLDQWYEARNEDGMKGQVPINFTEKVPSAPDDPMSDMIETLKKVPGQFHWNSNGIDGVTESAPPKPFWKKMFSKPKKKRPLNIPYDHYPTINFIQYPS